MAYALAHKGKATANVAYNPENPTSVYSNEPIHSCLDGYTSMAMAVHGPEYDPSAHDLDGEVVMRAGGGKKHGWFWIGDGTIDTASNPTLSHIRAQSTRSSPAIRPRPDSTRFQMNALQVISVLFIIHSFLHTFAMHYNIGMKYCRLSWNKKRGIGRS